MKCGSTGGDSPGLRPASLHQACLYGGQAEVEAKAEAKQVGAKAEAKQKLMIKDRS